MYSSRDHKVTLQYNAEERHLLIQVHGYRIKVRIHNHSLFILFSYLLHNHPFVHSFFIFTPQPSFCSFFFSYLTHNHPVQDQIIANTAGVSVKFLPAG